MQRAAVGVSVASLVSLCCAEPGSTPPGVSTWDSAGVEIVYAATPIWERSGPEWRVSSEPILEIGVAEGSEEYLLAG